MHSGIAECTEKIHRRVARKIAAAFHADGYTVDLVGHSLGAAISGLLAWRLKTQDGLERVRARAYACPACASPAFSEETKELRTHVRHALRRGPAAGAQDGGGHGGGAASTVSWEQMELAGEGVGRPRQAAAASRAKCAAPRKLVHDCADAGWPVAQV